LIVKLKASSPVRRLFLLARVTKLLAEQDVRDRITLNYAKRDKLWNGVYKDFREIIR